MYKLADQIQTPGNDEIDEDNNTVVQNPSEEKNEKPEELENTEEKQKEELSYSIDLTKSTGFVLAISEEEEDEFLCKICFENPENCTLFPCGHRDLCSICAKFMKLCPFCRSVVSGYEETKPQTLE